jgi:hypothetical protein
MVRPNLLLASVNQFECSGTSDILLEALIHAKLILLAHHLRVDLRHRFASLLAPGLFFHKSLTPFADSHL